MTKWKPFKKGERKVKGEYLKDALVQVEHEGEVYEVDVQYVYPGLVFETPGKYKVIVGKVCNHCGSEMDDIMESPKTRFNGDRIVHWPRSKKWPDDVKRAAEKELRQLKVPKELPPPK